MYERGKTYNERYTVEPLFFVENDTCRNIYNASCGPFIEV